MLFARHHWFPSRPVKYISILERWPHEIDISPEQVFFRQSLLLDEYIRKIYAYMCVWSDYYSWWINKPELSKNNRTDDWNVLRCRHKYWIISGDRWRQMYSKFWLILQNYHAGTSLDVVRFKYFTVNFFVFYNGCASNLLCNMGK